MNSSSKPWTAVVQRHVRTSRQAAVTAEIILHGGQTEHISAAAALVVFVAVPRVAAQPGDDARVLDGVVGVVEHRAADAHAGLGCTPACHLGQPVTADNLDVVIEQQQVLARRHTCGQNC